MLIVKLAITEKPERCDDCPLRVGIDTYSYCSAEKDHKDVQYDSWRPYWCPIEEYDKKL